MFRINDRGEQWHKVDLGAEGDIEIRVRPPTWDELCGDTESLKGYVAHRIATAIVGWSGVRDAAGGNVPFSPEALQAACGSSPRLFGEVLALANAAYRGMDRETEKNLPAPPEPPSTDAAAATEALSVGPTSDD